MFAAREGHTRVVAEQRGYAPPWPQTRLMKSRSRGSAPGGSGRSPALACFTRLPCRRPREGLKPPSTTP